MPHRTGQPGRLARTPSSNGSGRRVPDGRRISCRGAIASCGRCASSASQAEVLAYLRCHGIGATAQVVAPELRSVGDTLLAAGAEHEAGLLVMGAYSHSRLREMLLGGATRHILKNASARPVLLAH